MAPPTVASPACDQARLTLKQLGSAAQARATSYVEAIKKVVNVVAPNDKTPPPPPPPPPSTTTVIVLDQQDEKEAEASAKELAALREQLTTLERQAKEWCSLPALSAAYKAETASIKARIEALLAKHQASLPPQQLEEILSQRRLELNAAVTAEAAATEATRTKLAAFDGHAYQVNNDYLKKVAALNNAHMAAQKALDAERVDLIAALQLEAAAAASAVTAIRAQIVAAQALVQAAQPATAPAEAKPPDPQAAVAAAAAAAAAAIADAAAAAKQAQIDDLQLQLDLAKQQLAAPATAPPTPQARTLPSLPELQLTNDKALAQTWYVVRAGLLLLDVQDTALDVHWQELFAAGLGWTLFCDLVPASEVAAVEPTTDTTSGPLPTAKIPRRILGLLRAQLDALASLWTVKHAKDATAAEVTTLANDFITKVREEAFRVQHRKRPADTTPGSLKDASESDSSAALASAEAEAVDDGVTAGQHTQGTQE